MRRKFPLFKILFSLVALIALTVAGIHFYVTRKVDNEMVTLASQVSPVGNLEWGNIQIHPSGQIRIRDIRFTPHLVASEVQLQQLAFTAPNLIELLLAAREFDNNRLPKSLGLIIRGLEVPIADTGIDRLDAPFSTGVPFEAAGCGGREMLNLGDLPDLDIWTLVSDISLDYRLVDNGERARLRISSHTQYLAGMSMEVRLHLGSASRDLGLLARAGSMARLEHLDVNYQNLGFRDRLDRFCADELDITPDQFKVTHLSAWSAAWGRRGLEPSQDLLTAYRLFVAEPQSINLVFQPRQRLPLTAFTRMQHDELIDSLNPEVSVNEDRRVAVSFERIAAIESPPVAGTASPDSDSETSEDAPVRRIVWTEISPAQASSRIGDRVRITTAGGDRVTGELVEVDSDYLHMRLRSTGGFIVRPFGRQNVATVEVREVRQR